MLRDFSWEAFTKTGDINAYCLYKDVERVNTSIEVGSIDGYFEDKRNRNGLQ